MRSRSVPGFRQRGRAGVLVASGLAVAAIALVFAPVELPDRVEGVGRVLPAQEWVLVRTASGAVTATLRDHRTGAVSTTFAAEPARGDAVRFELGPAASQEAVEAGENVGMLASGEAALRLAAVRGEIEQAEAELRRTGAGAKPEVVEAARRGVREAEAERGQAEAEVARAKATAERQRNLFADGLTSAQALDDAEAAVRLAEARRASAQAQRATAEARVQVATSGERPEEAGVVRARIGALEREARSLLEREQMGTLVSPISGRVGRVFSPDTLLLVADTSAYHVLLPVRWTDRDRVRAGRTVVLKTASGEAPPLARIVDVREAAAPRAGQAYLVATAEVVSGAEHLVPGLLVACAVESAPMTPLQHVQRALRDLFRW
ncbi:HlyD family secretion protein [Rubricoccus marinus]|uniref:Multidrug resistance protein MdtA-like alpha-helical hairpin domain-containing protein n=1 Tax=Rubricoccus marinus TaxID=716817 RepID=A0A259TWA6_9BACT|nr:hypothetical protein [Rubricoccus marinus]OZC02045.1 hypothetical protein BSZ36_03040 [Rubricoccus marinus]